MFISYLKYKMSYDFIDFIKALQDKINSMNIVHCTSWIESYSTSIILFETQNKGHSEKCQNVIDVNLLYNGFLEMYAGYLPEVNIKELVIINNIKGKQTIALILEANRFIDMRVELADIFGYSYYPELDILTKTYKSTDHSELKIIEPISVVIPIISESYLKKGVNIFLIYSLLNDYIHSYGIMNKSFQTKSFVYETENKRGKKIQLW